jgi:hypothetical protein
MRKARIIATCLVNSNMMRSLEEAERAVVGIFSTEFRSSGYWDWNSEVNDDIASNIVTSVGQASSINVVRFIEQLWWRSDTAKFRRDIEDNYGRDLPQIPPLRW